MMNAYEDLCVLLCRLDRLGNETNLPKFRHALSQAADVLLSEIGENGGSADNVIPFRGSVAQIP